jgi:uncharacterized membrane protein YqjE
MWLSCSSCCNLGSVLNHSCFSLQVDVIIVINSMHMWTCVGLGVVFLPFHARCNWTLMHAGKQTLMLASAFWI